MTLFVGNVFDDERGRRRLMDDFGQSNVYFYTTPYNGKVEQSINVLRDMVEIKTKHRVIVLGLQSKLDNSMFKHIDTKQIIDIWKIYALPIIIKSDGKWELCGYTNEYINLIDKNKWGEDLYTFYNVLADEYSLERHIEKYIKDNCIHCQVNPSDIINYTTIYSYGAKCSRFSCGFHLLRRNSVYICLKCWVR